MKRNLCWPILPSWQCPCPQKGRQDICEEKSGKDSIQYYIFPRNRTEDSCAILVSVNSPGKCDLNATAVLSRDETDAAIQLSLLPYLWEQRHNQTSVSYTYLHFPDHIQEHTTDNSFPPVQRETRWLQKTCFASKAAYGILINNRLIDLSPLKNLICLLAEMFVPGKCYKTMIALKEPCHLFGDVLHRPLRKSYQKEPADRRRITKAGFCF